MRIAHREHDWERLQSFDREVYQKANRLRQDSDASPVDPTEYFNPNEGLLRTADAQTLCRSSSRPATRSRSFERLFSTPYLNSLLKSLQTVSHYRKGLRTLMKPASLPREKSFEQVKEAEPAGREFTTFDLGRNSDDLVPMLAKLAPDRFGREDRGGRRSVTPYTGSQEGRKKATPSRARRSRLDMLVTDVRGHCKEPIVKRKKYVDRSLLRAPSRSGPSNDATKEWEICMSMHLTAVRRKQEARKR